MFADLSFPNHGVTKNRFKAFPAARKEWRREALLYRAYLIPDLFRNFSDNFLAWVTSGQVTS